ncbi:cytochrome P450 [Deinococcus roseus]|uniref:Cytochrome P450 n=1 Tax=Deinococcus roseus TaxID=392414 RepID=A0ABQ2D1F6_9DEIO|nr:cytochrome P450 [Deinococcus roseus]GGJ41755.1 hypothetical protein GCM10008938_29770 [Deinococcus roseus]
MTQILKGGVQKTNREPIPTHRVSKDTKGNWHVYGFDEARQVLRSDVTTQAGFLAETVRGVKGLSNQPVLFMDGEEHRTYRSEVAKYFSPTTVEKYRPMMEQFVDAFLKDAVQKKTINLSEISLRIAVRVAGQVVGLTESDPDKMSERLEAFFQQDPSREAPKWIQIVRFLQNQVKLFRFYNQDVKPAVKARMKTPKEDVISHTLGKGYSSMEVLTECITYGAAGMVTTREFIQVAAWHLLEHPRLKDRYLVASEKERMAILGEILRLEPVVGQLFRRMQGDLELQSDNQIFPLKKGDLVVLHVYGANEDTCTVGEQPREVCPHRDLPRGVQAQVMSFGDGHHRCPGAFLALQETDIFLTRFLKLPVKFKAPQMTWNELIQGYELRNFQLEIG